LRRVLSQAEEEIVFGFIPQLMDPTIDSWLLSEEPEELMKVMKRD
jgi:hypothetical protein